MNKTYAYDARKGRTVVRYSTFRRAADGTVSQHGVDVFSDEPRGLVAARLWRDLRLVANAAGVPIRKDRVNGAQSTCCVR